MRKLINYLLLPVAFIFLLNSCVKEADVPPTKTNMEGVWTVSNVVTSQGVDITSRLAFPVLAFHLSSDGTVISTAGPLIMYVVYGDSKYTQIASQIDQVFNYATLSFNGGEFFVGGGEQKRFTLEMKLEGLPGQHTLTTLLQIMGLDASFLEFVVYHKFMNVGIQFADNYSTMIWDIDANTTAVYNTKDNNGNYLLWNGWPVNNFQHCTIRFSKQSVDIREVVRSASKK
ncbi:MAG: hypothetical protein WCP69_08000 [Bacteroidota bacterium]